MELGPTHYVLNKTHNIAYAVLGDGPIDMMYIGSGFVPFSMWLDYPPLAATLGRLASFSRLVLTDRRGVGASDPITAEAPGTTAEVGDDIAAIITALGRGGAVVFAEGLAVPAAIEVTAARPDLVSQLILFNGFARAVRAPDYPAGMDEAFGDRVITAILDGDPDGEFDLDQLFAPSAAGDEVFRAWQLRGGQVGASRRSAEILYANMRKVDVRHLLGNIQTPTLVLHRRDSRMFHIANGRYLAEAIPGARFVELDGVDQPPYIGDTGGWLAEVERFVTGSSSGAGTRVLSTMLFIDVVGSTEKAAEVGDRRWRELLDQIDQETDNALVRHTGRRITTTGDGSLTAFHTPTSAIAAAADIIARVASLGLQVRAGIHTGEVERRGDDLGGLAVNLTARILDLAGPGEILVSGALPAITIGSAITYESRGVHELRGVPGRWPVLLARLD